MSQRKEGSLSWYSLPGVLLGAGILLSTGIMGCSQDQGYSKVPRNELGLQSRKHGSLLSLLLLELISSLPSCHSPLVRPQQDLEELHCPLPRFIIHHSPSWPIGP